MKEETMLNHVSIGVRDLDRTKRFYDAALQPLGYRCLGASETSLGYGSAVSVFLIDKAERPVEADTSSHLHFCFDAPSRASVDAFHAAALKAGGSDNGAPGIRANYGPDYYAAFVVDLDGYRIEAYCGSES
jgi:catechol 2,3-dioxygenase-like lactoylglutathione lyase family enzyme